MAFFHISCRLIRHAMRHAACRMQHSACNTLHLAVSMQVSAYLVQVVFNTLISIVTHPQRAHLMLLHYTPSVLFTPLRKVKKKEIEKAGQRDRETNRFPFLQPISMPRCRPELSDKLLQTVAFLSIWFSSLAVRLVSSPCLFKQAFLVAIYLFSILKLCKIQKCVCVRVWLFSLFHVGIL